MCDQLLALPERVGMRPLRYPFTSLLTRLARRRALPYTASAEALVTSLAWVLPRDVTRSVRPPDVPAVISPPTERRE